MVYNQVSLPRGVSVLKLSQAVKEDILSIQEMQGTNLLYEEHDGVLFAYQLDDEGDVVAQYTLHVQLEKL